MKKESVIKNNIEWFFFVNEWCSNNIHLLLGVDIAFLKYKNWNYVNRKIVIEFVEEGNLYLEGDVFLINIYQKTIEDRIRKNFPENNNTVEDFFETYDFIEKNIKNIVIGKLGNNNIENFDILQNSIKVNYVNQNEANKRDIILIEKEDIINYIILSNLNKKISSF